MRAAMSLCMGAWIHAAGRFYAHARRCVRVEAWCLPAVAACMQRRRGHAAMSHMGVQRGDSRSA
jgi:hypothetical protein